VKPKYKRMLKGMQKKRRKKKGEPWFLYILECSDGSFYTGITKDIERRLSEHNKGSASKYTRLRLPVKLRYTEECAGRTEALVRECQVKALPRKKKEELVRGPPAGKRKPSGRAAARRRPPRRSV
jgi:putative endonuclease